jgi:hypothetical protein
MCERIGIEARNYFQSNAALALNGGTITDAATNNATMMLAAPGTFGSLRWNKNLVIN